MTRIPRTTRGYSQGTGFWRVSAMFDDGESMTANEVIENEYPSHSCVLGPDGEPLEYEPRARIGFVLGARK